MARSSREHRERRRHAHRSTDSTGISAMHSATKDCILAGNGVHTSPIRTVHRTDPRAIVFTASSSLPDTTLKFANDGRSAQDGISRLGAAARQAHGYDGLHKYC